MTYRCEFCQREFQRETSIAVHMCEQKRRRFERDEPGVRIGFQAYLRFYETQQGTARLKTHDDFCESAYYRAFVKFGRYCVATQVINPSRFMDWLLKNQKKIDNWCSDNLYTEYLQWYLPAEAVDDALARAMEYSMTWSETNGHPANHCLRYGNTNKICYEITTGRISPWVIYNSESGQKFLSECSSEQLAMIWPYINSDVWQKKFHDYTADQAYVTDILKKAGW